MPITKTREKRVSHQLPSRDPSRMDFVSAIAPRLGISKQTLSYAVARGEITVYPTASGRELIDSEEVREWIKYSEFRKREHLPKEWREKFFKTKTKAELRKYRKIHGLD